MSVSVCECVCVSVALCLSGQWSAKPDRDGFTMRKESPLMRGLHWIVAVTAVLLVGFVIGKLMSGVRGAESYLIF